MKLTVVVDNMTVKQGLLAEWGYSVWLQTQHGNLMLDTGGIAHVLMHNLQELGLPAQEIDHLVLSHGHFDHTSGIMDVLRTSPHAKVWADPSLGRVRWAGAEGRRCAGGGTILESLGATAIAPWVEIIPGVIAFTVPPQNRNSAWISTQNLYETGCDGHKCADTFSDDVSLLIQTEKGPSLVLGCAHAGLPNILGYVKKNFDLDTYDTILGGTHLCIVTPENRARWMEELAKYNVRHWRPCHCTGFKAAADLARHFDDVDWAAAGSIHEL